MSAASSRSSASRLRVEAPFDGEAIADVELTTAEQLEHCLAIADGLSRNRSAWLPVNERVGILERSARMLLHERLVFAMTAAHESGKPLIDAEIEVEQAIDTLKLCAEHVERSGDYATAPCAGTSHWGAFARGEPVGVVVARTAFNHPVNLVAHQIAPAVAAGCPVVVVPAASTPLSCLELARLLHTAGLPPGWCQVVISTDADAMEKIVADPRVRYFSFSGARAEGWHLRSKVVDSTRCFVARDGDAAVIVLDDAPHNLAIDNALKGAFYHAGQTLVRLREVLVPAEQSDAFVAELTKRAQGLRVGNPKRVDTQVGPLLRDTTAAAAERLVREAVKGGAAALTGGSPIGPTLFEPTVLLDPTPAQHPTSSLFGPVVRVRSYRSLEEVAQATNALPRLIEALVFTRDFDRAIDLYTRLNADTVAVNAAASVWTDAPLLGGLRDATAPVHGPVQLIEQMRTPKTLLLHTKDV